jgi:hypothetical protein
MSVSSISFAFLHICFKNLQQIEIQLNDVVEITNWKDGEYNDVMTNGLQVFILPDGLLGSYNELALSFHLTYHC